MALITTDTNFIQKFKELLKSNKEDINHLIACNFDLVKATIKYYFNLTEFDLINNVNL